MIKMPAVVIEKPKLSRPMYVQFKFSFSLYLLQI